MNHATHTTADLTFLDAPNLPADTGAPTPSLTGVSCDAPPAPCGGAGEATACALLLRENQYGLWIEDADGRLRYNFAGASDATRQAVRAAVSTKEKPRA